MSLYRYACQSWYIHSPEIHLVFLTADITVIPLFESSAEDIEVPVLTGFQHARKPVLRRGSGASMIVRVRTGCLNAEQTANKKKSGHQRDGATHRGTAGGAGCTCISPPFETMRKTGG